MEFPEATSLNKYVFNDFKLPHGWNYFLRREDTVDVSSHQSIQEREVCHLSHKLKLNVKKSLKQKNLNCNPH